MPAARDKLFLLRSEFIDANRESQRFYCPHCATIEGVLKYFPELTEQLDIEYVDFPRPRAKVVELVGEDNQSLPLLVLAPGNDSRFATGSYQGRKFLGHEDAILPYLAEKFGIPYAH